MDDVCLRSDDPDAPRIPEDLKLAALEDLARNLPEPKPVLCDTSLVKGKFTDEECLLAPEEPLDPIKLPSLRVSGPRPLKSTDEWYLLKADDLPN